MNTPIIDHVTQEFGGPPDFVPVPLTRNRADGWSPQRQQHFIIALRVMGSVGHAARAVGMSRRAAYRLRDRPGAESFAAAWDDAMRTGQLHQYEVALERALHGGTTVRVSRSGAATIHTRADLRLVNAVLGEPASRFATRYDY